MKIAVILKACSVGGWRWTYSVFCAIKKYYKNVDITIFYDDSETLPSDILKKISNMGISLKIVNKKFVRKKFLKIKIIDNIINSLLKKIKKITSPNFKYKKYINENFDIVYNAWPYSTKPIDFSIPSFFIPHDFIFTHFFGLHVGNVYNHKNYIKTKELLQNYLDCNYIPCVTSNYIKEEFLKTFPNYKNCVHKIMVVLKNEEILFQDEKNINILKKYKIDSDYILFPTNDMHHKNMEEAMTAYYNVKQKYKNIKLIIIGYGTNDIYVQMNSPYYADHIDENQEYDIKGLGLVSDEELQILIKNAKIVLNTSLCEAACGSGVDAWLLGTPTAISNIPCYKEQVALYGVKTEFFNPKNSDDISAAILKLLDNPEYAKENAIVSKRALCTQYTEKDMAEQYMNVFQQYI